VRDTLGTSSGRAPTRCTFSLCHSHLRFTTIARFAQERVRQAPDHRRRCIRFSMAGPSAPTALHPGTAASAASLSCLLHHLLPRPLHHSPLLDGNSRGARLRHYWQTWWALGLVHVPSDSATGTGPPRLPRCSSWVPLRQQCLRLPGSAREEGMMAMSGPTTSFQLSAYPPLPANSTWIPSSWKRTRLPG